VSSVDPPLAASIVALLSDLSGASGKTLLVNLHSVDLALRHFPRVVGIREGRVMFDLPPDRIDQAQLGALYAGQAQ
jgi:phosphonate transport system ATP-binding protein